MSFTEKTILGSSGLSVGRLGISSSFGAPAEVFEEAFERGCNYFTWGTFIRGRSSAMSTALRNLTAAGKRDRLVVGLLTYAHNAWLTERFFVKSLKAAGLDYADLLLLGYFSKRPSQKIIDGALRLKEKGLTRFIGLTGHNRKLFPELAAEGLLDVFHIRYNPAHRGAETETFPYLTGDSRPGVVSFTATRWRQLLDTRKMPPGQPPLTAAQCYRFALSHQAVDICMMGVKNTAQLRENLEQMARGPLNPEEMARIRLVGDHVAGRS